MLPYPPDYRPSSPSCEGDAQCRAQVRLALAAASISSLNSIGILVLGGQVRLVGRVPSFHMKQLAQEAARRVSGVGEVVNLLEVGPIRRFVNRPTAADDKRIGQ